MKEIEPKDLEQFNGENGRPVYIVHQDKVYDVSASKLWKNGLHMRRHHAGKDLTTDIQAAPHGLEVLERYPQVGVLKKEGLVEREIPAFLSGLLRRFPLLRRHPHPMTIHFPIVFMFAATVFTLLYLLTGIRSFESTALNCLGAGLFFTPVAIITGYYTWWLNYMARPLRPVNIKKKLVFVLLGDEIITFLWRITVPDIFEPFRLASGFYLILILSLLPLVTIIGWYGASMTFPIEKE
jgi:predicted heme/steroid binding protein/uncharacterized membrane protein